MLLRTPLLLTLVTTLASCGAPSTGEAAADVAPTSPTDSRASSDAGTATHEASGARLAAASAPTATDVPDPAPSREAAPAPMNNLYALDTRTLDGQPTSLADYKGKVTLVVNVASACGYTPQYAGLQKLHDELSGRGFAVLGFPSNEFGGQEPGTADEIREFCSSKYGVAFPMFAKLETKAGATQSPIYGVLEKSTGKLPNWNFCKYLVGRDGAPIAFYPSKVAPDSAELREAIEKALL